MKVEMYFRNLTVSRGHLGIWLVYFYHWKWTSLVALSIMSYQSITNGPFLMLDLLIHYPTLPWVNSWAMPTYYTFIMGCLKWISQAGWISRCPLRFYATWNPLFWWEAFCRFLPFPFFYMYFFDQMSPILSYFLKTTKINVKLYSFEFVHVNVMLSINA